jgi:D-3-phosphoglycerate dehydrogenase
MPSVLIGSEPIRSQPGTYRTLLEAAGFTVVDPPFWGMLRMPDLLEWLPGCEAIIAGGETISAAIMDKAPKLRVIARTGVGFDAVDVAAASERNIVVTITPGANHESVAEQTFALLLGLVKDLRAHDQSIRSGNWIRTPLPRPLRGLTIGLVGLGRIGRAVASRAIAFGMTVVAADPFAQTEPGIKIVRLDDLLRTSDVVSLHLPVLEDTRALFDRTKFAAMKPGSIFINTDRGGLMVESDLIEALESGHLAGAGLDVFNPEPPAPDNRLWSVPNLLFTPHMAGLDTLAMSEMARMAAQCIIDLHQGIWPEPCVINPEIASGWRWSVEKN